MKKRSIVIFTLILAMLFSFSACGKAAEEPAKAPAEAPAEVPAAAPAEAPAEEEYQYPTMTIQMGHISTEGEYDMYHVLAQAFKKNVEEKSGGAITIEVIANGQLGGERDMLEGMQIGTIDCGIVGNSTLAGVNEANYFAELPYVFSSNQDVWAFIDSDVNAEICQSVYENANVKVLGFGCIGFRNLLNNVRPITVPEDLDGIKLRVIESALMVDSYNLLGCNSTPMAFSELFTALQQGAIDGCDFPIVTAYTSRLFEVCKYFSESRAFFNATTISMGGAFWDSLDPQVQQLLEESAVAAGVEQREYCDECETMMLGWLADEGMEINSDVDFEAFQTAVQPIYDQYMDKIGEDTFNRAMEVIEASRAA